MNKDCGVIKDLIPLYVDDICSKESREKVEEHVEHCPDCLMTLERMKSKLVLPMEDSSDVKGFKKYVNRRIWSRALAVVLIFVLLWIVANFAVSTRWSEVWPDITAEGLQDSLEIVEIDGMLYLHQLDLIGSGEIVDISSYDGSEDGVFRFYLGKQGLSSLNPFGLSGSWQDGEMYQRMGQNPSDITKIIYCHKDGTEVAVLWEKGQEVSSFVRK